MTFRNVLVTRDGGFTTITMNRPERRNALSLEHLGELTTAFREADASDAIGIILAAEGPVFSAGHDFGEVAGADPGAVRHLLDTCVTLMTTIQSVRQPVVARVHGLATAAGCQLVCSTDLAVAAESAGFAIPGGKGGWFCHTPLVAVARSVGRKRALEMAMTGDIVDATTALAWGMVNRVVPGDELDAATHHLLDRATRGSFASKALGKTGFYEQVGLNQPDAYERMVDLMTSSSQLDDAQEGMQAFLEKRAPEFAPPKPA